MAYEDPWDWTKNQGQSAPAAAPLAGQIQASQAQGSVTNVAGKGPDPFTQVASGKLADSAVKGIIETKDAAMAGYNGAVAAPISLTGGAPLSLGAAPMAAPTAANAISLTGGAPLALGADAAASTGAGALLTGGAPLALGEAAGSTALGSAAAGGLTGAASAAAPAALAALGPVAAGAVGLYALNKAVGGK